jgi:hypothetical protein
MPAKVVTHGTTRQDLGTTAGESYRDGISSIICPGRSISHWPAPGYPLLKSKQNSRVDLAYLLEEHHPGSGIPLPLRRVTKAKPSPSLAPPAPFALWLEYHATQKQRLHRKDEYPRVSGISVTACFRLMTRL